MSIYKKYRSKIFSKETIISLIIIIFVFVLDRFSKTSIINQQLNNDSLFINNYLNFDLVWNTGVSFGLLSQNANFYYHAISFVIFLVIIFLSYLIVKANFLDKVSFSLGNIYDRINYFAVPDFIDIHFGDYHWFTFNIADIFITIGVIFLIGKDLILNKK